MDDLLGIDLIDCAGDNLAAIAPMVIFPASADKRVVTRYGEVASASFARPGAATYIAASGEVKQVGADVPRVGGTGWILEGSATNTALWSNSFTAANGHTLNDCTTSVSPIEYILTDESGAPRYATILTATANIGRVGRYNISVTAGTPVNWSIHVKAISGKFRFAGYDGSKAVSVFFDCATRTFSGLSDPSSISSQLQYEYIGNGWFRLSVTITPTVTSSTAAASIGLELAGNSGYISGAQFVVGPGATSYIYTEASAVTRASEGADTSNNGLSIPLSRAMIDSLVGERVDLSTAWIEDGTGGPFVTQSADRRTLTWAAGYGSSRAVYKGALAIGQTFEVKFSISGATATKGVRVRMGGGSLTGEYFADGAYTVRDVCTGSVNLNFIGLNGFAGSVYFTNCRRVLDSGQTNPGEGTLIQWVSLPWDSSVIPNSGSVSIVSTDASAFRQLAIQRLSGGTMWMVRGADGISASAVASEFSAGRYAFISQWSATLGRMRVGLYNPATGALTWSSPTLAGATPYRGFFPIHSSNRLRWFYGGGNFPIHVGGLRWSNSIVSDAECVRLSKEMLP